MKILLIAITYIIAVLLGMVIMSVAMGLMYTGGTLNVRKNGMYFVANDKLNALIGRKAPWILAELNIYEEE